MSDSISQAVSDTLPPDDELVSATVAAVNPLTLNIRGALVSESLGVLGSYVPVLGDVVSVLRQDATWLVLGSTQPGTDATLSLAGYNGTAADTTAAAAYTNLDPVRFDFVKRSALTRVRVDLSVSCYTTAVTTKPRFGVDFINAPTERRDIMEMLINTANEHTPMSAVTVFDGFAAGAYTVQLLWLRVSGAGTLTINADDWVSLLVTEVP
jgi:hypothetical protein